MSNHDDHVKVPGNVRDLKQVIARMLWRHSGHRAITVGCIPPNDRPTWAEDLWNWRHVGFERFIRVALARGVGLKTISRETEETAIRIALEKTGGNLQRAALRLGVTDRALQIRRAAQRQENLIKTLRRFPRNNLPTSAGFLFTTRRKKGRIASYTTLFTTWKRDKKTSLWVNYSPEIA